MKNLVSIYRKIDGDTVSKGLAWYRDCHTIVASLAARYGHSVDKVAGIFAALSPGTNYEQNKRDCEAMLKIHAGLLHGHKYQTYGQNVGKARAILNSSADPLTFFSDKTGPKTRNFYLNILNPGNPEPVTIDRHAFAIATGETYTGLRGPLYRQIAEHYRKAAQKLGLVPCEFQAVLWVDYRNKQNLNFKEYTPF